MSHYVQQNLRVANSQKTPRHVGTNLRMSSRDVRISAIKRTGGKTTQYYPSPPRLDPHDVTPQSYPDIRDSSLAWIPGHYNFPGSKCQLNAANWGKVQQVYRTPSHFHTQLDTPVGVVWVRVGGFQKLTTLRTLEAKWHNLNIYHVWDPYLYTNDKAITQACQTLMAYTFVQGDPNMWS